MRVIDIDDVIYAMRSQTQFVLRCEEVFHDKISAAAGAILSAQPRKPYVCLTGPLRLRQDDHRHAPEGVSGKPGRQGLPSEHG